MGKYTILQIPGMRYFTWVCPNQSISGLIFFPYRNSLGIRKFSPQKLTELHFFMGKILVAPFFGPPETGQPEFITSCAIAECMAFTSKLQRSNTMWRLHLRCNCRRHHYHTLSNSKKVFLIKNYYELTSELSLRHTDYIALCRAQLQLQRQRRCSNTLKLFMNSGEAAWRISQKAMIIILICGFIQINTFGEKELVLTMLCIWKWEILLWLYWNISFQHFQNEKKVGGFFYSKLLSGWAVFIY